MAVPVRVVRVAHAVGVGREGGNDTAVLSMPEAQPESGKPMGLGAGTLELAGEEEGDLSWLLIRARPTSAVVEGGSETGPEVAG